MELTSVRGSWSRTGKALARGLIGSAVLGMALWSAAAQAVTVTVRHADGTPVVAADLGGFRYTIEEDSTFDVVPDVTGLSGLSSDKTLSLEMHRSHMKVVKVGRVTGNSLVWSPPDSSKRYFISVMPNNPNFSPAVGDANQAPRGYTNSGVPIRPGDSAVYVPLNKIPFKTAQVSVFVFEDTTLNGAPDAPGSQERGLCGFEVQLFEAGGTYGASGGRVGTDTFGNWLGTEYLFVGGVPQYNADGSLAIDTSKPHAGQGSFQLFADANGVVRIKNLSPAKYTIYVVPPPDMPTQSRCHLSDAAGEYPIWVRTAANLSPNAARRATQMVWNNGFELPPKASDGERKKWHQTSTIEGTWGIDAWVKAGEPTFFKEFGPPGHHVFVGFTRRYHDTSALNGTGSVNGTVKNTHMSRPPAMRFFSGAAVTTCWVGINTVNTAGGLGTGVHANACNPDGSFNITGLQAGQRYQLVVWDEPLDNVIANYEFTVPAGGGAVAMGDVPVFSWFHKLAGTVFYDADSSGFPFDTTSGATKPGIPGSVVNVRFRDGSIYTSTATDDEGNWEIAEMFPFFNWMTLETDFTRFKATGATVIADNGGAVVNPSSMGHPDGLWPDGSMAPQIIDGLPYRIFGGTNDPTAPSSANLLQTFQGFLGQTNIVHWGKREYNHADPRDHGGITGVIHYASTRSEFDPKFATAENNEPGIPSVEVRLYKVDTFNRVIDPLTNAPIVSTIPGVPHGAPQLANEAHAVQVVVSDDYNKSPPEGCVDPIPYTDRTGVSKGDSCYDGMRVWNQVRDGVFDGGWAFVDYCPGGAIVDRDPVTNEYVGTHCRLGDADLQPTLPPGRYMTEGIAPYGYEHQKEEDKNVDFGDLLVPGTLANPAECVGSRDEARDGEGNLYFDGVNPFLVPEELETFAGVAIPDRFRDGPGYRRPYCNKKMVVVAPGMNPFSDFHMFAKAPVAGHIVGMILDDLANEFDPYSPSFGEKYAPPFMPISIRDYAGNEINRVYSDRYGTYNAMVPSTFAYNVPLPSGVAPNMVNVCLNSPTLKDAAGNTVLDPHYNPSYSQYCYTFQYLPGKTTYLDTPVLPIAAFAGPSQYALDTEQPNATPAIKMVTGTTTVNGVEPGPWVPGAGTTVRIMSMGSTMVPNPSYDQNNLGTPGPTVAPKNIARDFGFGAYSSATSRVLIGGVNVPVTAANWTNAEITVTVPASVGTGGTIEVVRGNGRKTVRGVTLHVGTTNMPGGHTVPRTVGQGAGYQFQSIQAAIDDASTRDGDLITVAPGIYEESPIVYKRVRIQGYGAPATVINASMGVDYIRQAAWRSKICNLLFSTETATTPLVNALMAFQTVPANRTACLTGDTTDNAPLLFGTEESSGFFVLQTPLGGTAARQANGPFITGVGNSAPTLALQIDGFMVTGADTGGGIVANGNAVQLQISNNRITGNQGLYNGGIRIGHAGRTDGANNLLVNIHHNEILKNGNLAGEVAGGGGGISIYTGASGYRVAQNYIAGNYSTGDGGGMAHVGVSNGYTFLAGTTGGNCALGCKVNQDNRTNVLTAVRYDSVITDNQFRFNQSFSQMKSVQGGGLAIQGEVDPTANNGLSTGTGNVLVANNNFQGNLAGAGDGGGIALSGVNGAEINGSVLAATWYRVDIVNNVIATNGAGVAGGGISLLDSPNVNIINNTIALNDNYATASRAFANGDPTQAQNNPAGIGRIATSSLQNGAGIAAYRHSAALLGVMPTGALSAVLANKRYWSDATITNNVVVGNRRFNWEINYNADPTLCSYSASAPCFGLIGPALTTAPGNDIAVLGGAPATLAPTYSVFTSAAAVGGSNNRDGVTGDFASWNFNGERGALGQLVLSVEQTVVCTDALPLLPNCAPIGEVQEPTVATTAAAFDEGGNFIDVRFGPLTRGALNSAGTWIDFGIFNPTSAATGAASGDFRAGQLVPLLGLPDSLLARSLLQRDRNGQPRSFANWIRGALNQ